MDFGDLDDDPQIKEKLINVHKSIEKIRRILQISSDKEMYQKLETMDKINLDLFQSYSLNTLYWMYLRTKGIDPNRSDVKNELNRVKDYMVKAKKAHERKTIRPRLNVEVSKRFVRNGLWNPSEPTEPMNKRIKME